VYDIDVLVTPREAGGHEKALLGWLRDAVAHDGLHPRLLLPAGPVRADAEAAGLGAWIDAREVGQAPVALLNELARGPRQP